MKVWQAVEAVNERLVHGGVAGGQKPLPTKESAHIFAGTLIDHEEAAEAIAEIHQQLVDVMWKDGEEHADNEERQQWWHARVHGVLITVLLIGYELGVSVEREVRLPPDES